MAKSKTKYRVCSQESSISSLLASCSLSSSNSSNSVGSFHYKDKLYSSASQALQAYIDDFDLSQVYPSASTGKISIDKGAANIPHFSSYISKPSNGTLLFFVFIMSSDLKHKQVIDSKPLKSCFTVYHNGNNVASVILAFID